MSLHPGAVVNHVGKQSIGQAFHEAPIKTVYRELALFQAS